MNEWLLIDKVGDYHYFKDIKSICDYLDLTKSQVNNIFQQSLKHINRYTNRGYYIQRLYNNPHTHQRTQFSMNKYIYCTDHTQDNQNYVINKFKNL